MIDYLSVLCKHESGQRMHGLSGVEIALDGLWVFLKLKWNPLHPRTPPIQISGAFALLEPHFHLFFFFFWYQFCYCFLFFFFLFDSCYYFFFGLYSVSDSNERHSRFNTTAWLSIVMNVMMDAVWRNQ